mmetsp:Transcript_3528/g.5316  ORF Transcript_3528/g.5316 Transcript_3528/m.5316 type:complete len:394 (+) Transcript_3528:77-1258(+)
MRALLSSRLYASTYTIAGSANRSSPSQHQYFRNTIKTKGYFSSLSSFASVDGVPITDAAKLQCSVWDMTFQRGDGVFDVCRVVPSSSSISDDNMNITDSKMSTKETAKPRCINLHLDRLERSAAAINLKIPPRNQLEQWLRDAAKAATSMDSNTADYGILRCIITRGGGFPGYGDHLGESLDAPSKTFIMWQPITQFQQIFKLLPICAPWHPGGFGQKQKGGYSNDDDNDEDYNNEWSAIKWLSYGFNVHTTRLSRTMGFDDALLLARGYGVPDDDTTAQSNDNRVVLDGPNFALAWITHDNTFCTPCWKQLGLLQSTTCTIAIDAARRIGFDVQEGIYRLADIKKDAKAVWVMSTTRNLIPVVSIGDFHIPTDFELQSLLVSAMDGIIAETP